MTKASNDITKKEESVMEVGINERLPQKRYGVQIMDYNNSFNNSQILIDKIIKNVKLSSR